MTYPEEALAHGVARHRAGHFAEARSVYESLISQSLDSRVNGAALAHLATLHLRENRVVEAQMASGQALQQNEDNGTALWAWVQCQRRMGHPEHALEPLLQRSSHSLPPQLLHEMGLSYEALGEFGKAYMSFKEAKRRISFANLDVDRELLIQYMEQVGTSRLSTTTSAMDQKDEAHLAPVFIVGFNESGVSELGRMLARHPDLRLAAEVPAIVAARKQLDGKDPSQLNGLTEEDLHRARSAYFSTVNQRIPGTQRIVDALPMNLLAAGLIQRLFPESPIVHCIRHPHEAVINTFIRPYTLNNVTCHFDRLERTALTYAGVMSLAHKLETVDGVAMATLRYEDLMTHPEVFLNAIAADVGISWAGQPRIAPRTALPRWRNYSREMSRWLPTLDPLARDLGYPAK